MKKTHNQLDLFAAVVDAPEVGLIAAPEAVAPRRRPKPQPDPPLPPAITGAPASQSFTDFYIEHGRTPMIHDERKPWTYCGWLFWYRFIAEELRPDVVPPRWHYWYEIADRKKLPARGIPKIDFSQADESERSPGFKHLDSLVQLCARKLSDFNRIDPLLDWMLFAFGASKGLPDFPDDLHDSLYRTLNLEHFLTRPSDYFGSWIGANKGRWNPHAFFATPHHICELMTLIAYDHGRDCRAEAFYEPAIGTGRMALHASNFCLRIYGQDVDQTVLKACKLNGMLYAPWLAKALPEEIFETQLAAAEGAEHNATHP